jgi:hypothetical protein
MIGTLAKPSLHSLHNTNQRHWLCYYFDDWVNVYLSLSSSGEESKVGLAEDGLCNVYSCFAIQ